MSLCMWGRVKGKVEKPYDRVGRFSKCACCSISSPSANGFIIKLFAGRCGLANVNSMRHKLE